jgi:hypothetical protein
MNKKIVSNVVLAIAVGFRPQVSAKKVPTIEQTKHQALRMIFWYEISVHSGQLVETTHNLKLGCRIGNSSVIQHSSEIV